MKTINELVEKFTINPKEDIEPYFKLTKEYYIDATKVKGCLNCGNENNNKILDAIPWTYVQYCWICNHLNVVYVTDRMSGVSEDKVKCYTDNE
jgi:hypothetical protein